MMGQLTQVFKQRVVRAPLVTHTHACANVFYEGWATTFQVLASTKLRRIYGIHSALNSRMAPRQRAGGHHPIYPGQLDVIPGGN